MARAGSKTPSVKTSLPDQFKQRILRNYFVRFHMTLILMAVVAAGLLVNKLMLMIGLGHTMYRYPAAVLGSYLVFVGLVRLWIAYVCSRGDWNVGSLSDLDVPNLGSGSGGGGIPEPIRFGGGTSGGGGASDAWCADAGVRATFAPPQTPAISTPNNSGGGSWKWPSFDFNCDVDDLWIILVLAVVVIAVIVCGGYLIWVAPEILPEVAMQAVIVPAIAKRTRQVENNYWAGSLVRSTVIPFLLVLLLTVALGWLVHNTCPGAVKLMDALNCTASN